MAEIVKRFKMLAFYGVPTVVDGTVTYTYHRMKGFDEISTSKNPKEYTRKYIDEEFEQTDVVGYTPSISFGLDRIKDNEVHDDIADIFNNEKTGDGATRPIIMVDMSGDKKTAIKREFTVVAEKEGDGSDAYRYSGSFKVKSARILGVASSSDEWQTCTFAENE